MGAGGKGNVRKLLFFHDDKGAVAFNDILRSCIAITWERDQRFSEQRPLLAEHSL
jgi:hypothetical protein